MKEIFTPISKEQIKTLKINDQISISGKIYAARDAALARIVKATTQNNEIGVPLEGGVIFHTAVSPAGIGPTSSNKLEIESSIPLLSKLGIRIHLGKGSLSKETVGFLKDSDAIFAITPPVSALLSSKIISSQIGAFSEEGIEALYILEVKEIPAIVAIAQGQSIFE